MPQMVLRQWIYEQKWEDRSDGWVLVKEKELKPLAKAGPKAAP
jgi:hypothetical protein